MPNPDNSEPIEPSLLDTAFHEIMEDQGIVPATPSEVRAFLRDFAAKFAGDLTPTPEEWERIQAANKALREKIARDEEADTNG
jgi:hypothetical protein